MKIGFCTPGSGLFEDYKNGNLLGIESQVYGLSKELVKRDFEVYIFRRWNTKKEVEIIDGINIVNINSVDLMDGFIQKTLTKINFSYFVRKAIKKHNIDLVILTDVFSSYFISSLKIPKIYVTHNPPSGLPSEWSFKNNIFNPQFIKKFVEKKVYNNSDVIVALNSHIQVFLQSQGYKVVFIPNGINCQNYNLENEDKKYILAVGRLIKLKGFDYLIKAYSTLNNRIKNNYELVIVGNGPEEKSLKDLANNLEIENKVRFINWLSKKELIKKISSCSIFVFPSLFETFGIVLIEAMACGKATISSDIPTFKDIISNGVNGILFNRKVVKSLKDVMEYILVNEAEKEEIGKNAKKTVKRYDFKYLAENYIKIFNEIGG